MSESKHITYSELLVFEEKLKKHMTSLFEDQERWHNQRMKDHEAQERLMMEPIIKLVAELDNRLSSTNQSDLGLSYKVQALEQEQSVIKDKLGKKAEKYVVWYNIPGVGAALAYIKTLLGA